MLLNTPILAPGVIPPNWSTGATMPPGSTYSTYFGTSLNSMLLGQISSGTITEAVGYRDNRCGFNGYSNPYSSQFSTGTN